MKILTACLPLVWMPMVVTAQLTAYSDVAGFDTIPIAGTGGSGSKLTFASTEFLQAATYSGFASVVGSNTLIDAAAAWADDEFKGDNGSHYVEIVSVNGLKTAAGVGVTRSIVTTLAAAKTITLEAALPAGLTAPVEYRIIRHWTLETLFGSTNTAGLQGGTPLSADQVQLWNGNGYESYYYQTAGIGGIGWRKIGNQTADASHAIVRPEQNVIIKRVGVTGVSMVVNGWVKTGQTSFDIVTGFNFVPNPYSVPMTLASSGLYKGSAAAGIAGGNVASADQVLLWNGSSYETFYYQTSGLGGTGWRKLGQQSTDASGASITPGGAIILRRKDSDGFTWAIPQH